MRLKFIKKEQKQQNTGAHDCEHTTSKQKQQKKEKGGQLKGHF